MTIHDNALFLDIEDVELEEWLSNNGEKSFRTKQIFQWIYKKSVRTFDEMKNVGSDLVNKLKIFIYPSMKIKDVKFSEEIVKFLFELHDGNFIESVLIIAENRKTLCISSQVGCKFGCKFCASGALGFSRNLSSGEIVEQIVAVNNVLMKKNEVLSHIVFMGMGEPLDNFENVSKAILNIINADKLRISRRRITISTVGVPEKMKVLADKNLGINLALSLHAPNQKLREQIMPAAKIFPIGDVLLAADYFFEKTSRNITYEYVLIDKVNCEKHHAEELAKLLKNRQCSVNLITYNEVGNSHFRKPSTKKVENFFNSLNNKGIVAIRRYSKGSSVDAACGQLARKVINE